MATGYLLRPVDGFRSPPHIHNVSYRAVVIRGLVHNADPKATDTWMGPGSFWTQPKGAVHITAARGSDTLAYIEIDEGPYLVHPVEQAFESSERAVNVDASNVVWVEAPGRGYRVAYLWGTPADSGPCGVFVRLSQGASGHLRSASPIRAVVVAGRPVLTEPDAAALDPGGYLQLSPNTDRELTCPGDASCVLYLRIDGKMDLF